MKRFRILSAVILLAILMMGNTQCQGPGAIVLPEGPKATELGKTKDEQIVALKKQVTDTETQRATDNALAAKAASNLKGIEKAKEYLPDTPAKEAIGEESKLARERLPADDPAETVKALERVVLLITGQRDEALRQYHAESDATKAAIQERDGKDRELQAQKMLVTKRDAQIVTLEQEKLAEQTAHKDDVQKALDKKDAEIKQIKDEAASKERATWVLWTRIAGLGFIVIGAVIAIVFKVIPEGASFVGVGVLIGLVSIFIDWLTAQVWFPWLCGGIILAILGIGGYALYRMWKNHSLQTKVTAALQDLKDESSTLGNDLWKKVSEHLDYRLGPKDSEAQKKLVASLGLISPEGEKAISSANPAPTQS